MSNGRWTVPASWCWETAEAFSTVVGGGTPPASDESNFAEDGIRWITPADLSGYSETHIERGRRDLSQKGYDNSGAQLMPKGTVLISSRAPVGYCAVAANPIATNQGFKSLVLRDGIVPEFVRYYVIGSKQYLESQASGTTFKELSGRATAQLLFPLAPTKEQRRIVAKIDELFSQIDEGERNLKRVQTLLKQYRQSVLKAAVTGELTKDWRAKNAGKGETGADLLKRILKARRETWEAAELAKMKAKGKTPKDNDWQKKYQEPEPPDTSGLPKLPDGWVWATLDALTHIKGGVTVDSKRSLDGTNEVPYLRVANVQRGHLDLRQMKRISVDQETVSELQLVKGDILLNEGGDIDKLGRGWVWEGQIEHCIHQNHVFRARPYCPEISSYLVSSFTNLFGQEFFVGVGKQTTNLASVSLSKLRTFPVPVMPADEAKQLESLVLEYGGAINRQTEEFIALASSVSGMQQSILRAAFFGQLVAQDPSDEPASELLKRIASAASHQDAVALSAKSAVRRGRKSKHAKTKAAA